MLTDEELKSLKESVAYHVPRIIWDMAEVMPQTKFMEMFAAVFKAGRAYQNYADRNIVSNFANEKFNKSEKEYPSNTADEISRLLVVNVHDGK